MPRSHLGLILIQGLLCLSVAQVFADDSALVPVPDAAAQAKAEKLISDTYKPYPPAKPAEQKALAFKLLERSTDKTNDSILRYMYLRDALKLSSSNADFETALTAIGQIAHFYHIDKASLQADALRKTAGVLSQPAAAQELLIPLLRLSDEAMKDGNYALSVEAATAADKASRATNDPYMAVIVKEQLAEATQIQTAYQAAKSSLDVLAKSPEDAGANLVAGKFICFALNTWEVGLPMFVKGSDASIRGLIELDKAAGGDAASQTKAADAWWEYAQSQTGANKRGVLRRAAHWYEQALPSVTGLNRPAAQKRLDEASAGGKRGMSKVVDLRPLIQPRSDAIRGAWRLDRTGVMSDASVLARIEAPYEPPAEYDFRIEFTRTKGENGVVQILSAGDSAFTWEMGAFGNIVWGFDEVDGKRCTDNPTTVQLKNELELNHRYTAMVQVRKDVVRAYMGTKLISEWKTDFKDMSIPEDWKLKSAKSLGFGSHETPTIFHSMIVVEVRGVGKRTRVPHGQHSQ